MDARIRIPEETRSKLGLIMASEATAPHRQMHKPQAPVSFLSGVHTREKKEAGVNDVALLPRPYPSLQGLVDKTQHDEAKNTGNSSLFTGWAGNRPGVHQDGLITRRTHLRQFIQAMNEDTEEVNQRVYLLRNMAQELRQAFDAHSVNLSALAGGFAHDGLGFSLSKKLNTINLGRQKSISEEFIEQSAPAGQGDGSDGAGDSSGDPAGGIGGGTGGPGTIRLFPKILPFKLPHQAIVAAPKVLLKARPSIRTEKRHPVIKPRIISDGSGGKRLINDGQEDKEIFGVMRHVRPDLYQMDNAEHSYRQLYYETIQTLKRCGEWGRHGKPRAGDWDRSEVWQTDFTHAEASRTPAGGGRMSRDQFRRIGPDKKLRSLHRAPMSEVKSKLAALKSVHEIFDLTLTDQLGATISRKDPHRWLVALGQRKSRIVSHVEAVLRKWENIARVLDRRIEEAKDELADCEQELSRALSYLKKIGC